MAEGRKKRPVKEKKKERALRLNARKKRILSIIKDNPEGIALPEIAYIMGIEFFAIIEDIKKLLNSGYIRKRRNKYFLG